MHHRFARVLVVLAVALGAALPLSATCGGGGGGGMGGAMPMGAQPQVYFVPWKILNSADDAVKTPLILYWLPASAPEVKRSELLTSRPLTMFASQCVGMQLVRPDDAGSIDK